MALGTLSFQEACGTHPGGNRLTWVHTGSISGVVFQVQYQLNGAPSWTDLAVVPGGTTVYEHAVESEVCTLDVNYRVLEYTNSALTDTSNTVNCTNPCTLTPVQHGGLTVTCPTNYAAVRLTWSTTYPGDVSHSSYVQVNIYRDTDVGFGSPTLIASVPLATGLYDDATVVGGTTYYYNATFEFTTLNTTEGAIAASQVSCVVPSSPCGSSYPPTTLDFSMQVDSTCSYIVLPGLINSAGNFIIPTEQQCDDISSITAITLRYANCTSDVTKATAYTLSTSSDLYYSIASSFRLPVSVDGVYNVQLTVTYDDLLGDEKELTATRCILVYCNNLECNIATAILNEEEYAEEALLLFQGLQAISNCQDCAHACQMYTNITNLLDDGCNC